VIDKIDLPSGAKLYVGLLSFDEAWSVVQTITRVLEKINIDLTKVDLANIGAEDILNLKSPLCSILSSEDIIVAAKACFKRCTYNDKKIDGSTFDSKESRGDFLAVVFHAIKENVSPFFASLSSVLGTK